MNDATVKIPLNSSCITGKLSQDSESWGEKKIMSELRSHTHILASKEQEGVSGPSSTSTEGRALPPTKTCLMEDSLKISSA